MRSRRREPAEGEAEDYPPRITKEGVPDGGVPWPGGWMVGGWAVMGFTDSFRGILGPKGRSRDRSSARHLSRGFQPRFFFSSIILWMIGVRMISMAKPILPPFTTMLVGLDMKESWIMRSR